MALNNSTLYLLAYNNYLNRIVKVEQDIDSYLNYQVYQPLVCNFNPADGIDTSHTFNVPHVANTPYADYVIVVDEDGDITSRWFIVNATRTRGGQYTMSLHRDLVADYYEEIIKAPCYIERAMVSTGSPFLFNNEGMRFNQIKKKEVLLKDKTNTPWIVGYLANNYAEAEGADADNITASFVAENTVYPELSWLDYRIIHTIYTGGSNQTLITRLRNIPDGHIFDIKQNGSFTQKTDNPNTSGLPYVPAASTNFFCNITGGDTTPVNTFIDDYYNAPKFTADLSIAGFTNTAPYIENISELLRVSGMKVRNTDYISGQEETNGPEFFYVSLIPQGTETHTVYLPVAGAEYNRAKALIQGLYQNGDYSDKFEFRNYSANVNTFAVEFTTMKYAFGLSRTGVPTTVKTSFLNLQGNEKKQLIDAPYVMFATPYFDISYVNAAGQQKQHNGEAARNLSAEAIKRFSGGYAYDLQLLPYCPIPSLIKNGVFDMTGLQGDTFSNIWAGENEIGFFVFCENSSFSNVIDLDEPILLPQDAIQAKIDVETKMCRLVSPNYAGAFEFTPLKNGGVSQVEVNCTYKPYQPYLHIAPVFNAGYLYGGDFNDNRGLICGGEFSLPQASDAWISYQSQNKSYREAFNRQVENMETNYNINREQMMSAGIASIGTAVVSGAAGGAIAGSTMAPGIGTAVGAAAGVASGLVSGALSGYGLQQDLKAAEALHKEAKSFAQAQFDYSLQNIQALPVTMSRTSAFDTNNKLFPFLEFYEATPDEEKALRNKIKYNSMTVMAISTIEEYIKQEPTFISGQIIRLEDIDEDYHCAAAIVNEIHKGVYI